MEGFLDDVATYDDEELAEAEDDAASRSGRIQVELTDTSEQEIALLKRMEQWAARYETMPDAKAKELITYLIGVCRPDGKHWTNERVVVFTEYRDTQIWLKELLAQEGLSGERVKLLYGGMDTRQREQLRLAFQAPPDQNQVRILLATDAASEGIDLHEHCHRLVNYDIPFNPNKLEQRIGRIDRYGQPETPQVRHFIGKGSGDEHRLLRGRSGVPRPGRGQSGQDGNRISARSTRCWPMPCRSGCSVRSTTTTWRTRRLPRESSAGGDRAGSPPTPTCQPRWPGSGFATWTPPWTS